MRDAAICALLTQRSKFLETRYSHALVSSFCLPRRLNEVVMEEDQTPEHSPPDDADRDPIVDFLAQPSHHYDDDDVTQREVGAAVGPKMSLSRRLYHFLFEKSPSGYSSIAPRRADGTRTKIFFFNGNGRGR
jgi:hypothetical protein